MLLLLHGHNVILKLIDDGRTVALEVVPEPASALLLGLGGMPLLAPRRH